MGRGGRRLFFGTAVQVQCSTELRALSQGPYMTFLYANSVRSEACSSRHRRSAYPLLVGLQSPFLSGPGTRYAHRIRFQSRIRNSDVIA